MCSNRWPSRRGRSVRRTSSSRWKTMSALSRDVRRSVADRMETLAGAKEVEVTRLRAALQSAQASTAAHLPRKLSWMTPLRRRNLPRRSLPRQANPKPAPGTPATAESRRSSAQVGAGRFRLPPPQSCDTTDARELATAAVQSFKQSPKLLKTLQLHAWNSACRAGVYIYRSSVFRLGKGAFYFWARGGKNL